MSDEKTTPKKAKTPKKKATGPKQIVKIDTLTSVDKPIPAEGSDSKYGFLATMAIGDCLCIPPGATNVNHDTLRAAIMGAAKRRDVKVVCKVEEEGFCIWRKE